MTTTTTHARRSDTYEDCQLDGCLLVAQAAEGNTDSPAAGHSSPAPAGKGNDAVPAAASTGKKKLLDVRTMLLVAAGDQNADPAAAGALLCCQRSTDASQQPVEKPDNLSDLQHGAAAGTAIIVLCSDSASSR